MKTCTIGKYICADPKICHGQPTFRGTRILVSDILELVAEGLTWDSIVKECRGSITRAAIADAIRFARRSMVEHARE
jgi:uncharacterized protein (DUF433 family)